MPAIDWANSAIMCHLLLACVTRQSLSANVGLRRKKTRLTQPTTYSHLV